MHVVTPINADEFLTRVKPSLHTKDWQHLVETVNAHWTPAQIRTLLPDNNADVRKLAALCIGLVGDNCCIPSLTERFHDTDAMVIQMAEHALWQIWFRGGTPEANSHLARGAEALNRHEMEHALEHLNEAIALCPDFAEAYNQRATAYYMGDCFADSIIDCERAIQLMPLHYGAWTGMGHAHLALAHRQEAMDAYTHALAINPHLDCVAELVHELSSHDAQK